MLDRDTLTNTDKVFALLLHVADKHMEAGDQAGAFAVRNAADAVMAVLDLDHERCFAKEAD